MSVEGSVVQFLAAPGELNQVAVDPSPPDPAAPGSMAVTVTDAGAPLTAGPGCAPSGTGATCVTAVDSTIDVSAGDLGDFVTVNAGVPAIVDGGPGDDVMELRNGLSDTAWCGSGRDWVTTEVLDFLDLGCERVDYLAAGSVGRTVARTGGGRLVSIPGQTWARVDRRILPDVLYMIRRYHVRVADGYATSGHTLFGEHPIGLAVDLGPGPGGTWADVSRLARWAEPRQNRPRVPFRFVGWNGDFNHGHPSVCKPRRGCAPHLHLSWSHSHTRPHRLARTVWVFEVRLPGP